NNKLQLAYIKKGRLDVRGQIYNDAIDAFKKALEIDEKYPIVHKELGEVYYFTKQYDKMIEEFKKYIALSPGDNKARISLLSMLFANKDYDKCVDEANKGLQSDPKNPDYYRFVFYSDYELKRYKDGYDAMKKFMDLPNVTHKPRDIIYAARLANSVSDTTLALQLFPQALANDSANCELMSEYAKALFVARHYDEAIAQYNAKKAKCGDVNSVELYYMGRVYLLLDDSLDADTTFGEFIKRNPTSPDGYYWRARTNLKIGKPEDFLSFPYYDKYVEIAGSDPAKYKNNLIEAYDYLGAYYFEKDKAKSKDYFNKVLELDPNDEFGKEFMKQFR
ncbi:MAG TPA: tetratricopeptide repeat protein, partial [Chitinophagales bacterium]|nr:tetratricopeptide repeat protein [Chitinophagales bacterium]